MTPYGEGEQDDEPPLLDCLWTAQREEAMRAFDYFDKDGNGSIDLNEFLQLAKTYGRTDAEQEFRLLDFNGDGELDRDEFLMMYSEKWASVKQQLLQERDPCWPAMAPAPKIRFTADTTPYAHNYDNQQPADSRSNEKQVAMESPWPSTASASTTTASASTTTASASTTTASASTASTPPNPAPIPPSSGTPSKSRRDIFQEQMEAEMGRRHSTRRDEALEQEAAKAQASKDLSSKDLEWRVWLEELQLGQYGAALEGLGAASLRDMRNVSEEDLQSLGFKKLEAHRFLEAQSWLPEPPEVQRYLDTADREDVHPALVVVDPSNNKPPHLSTQHSKSSPAATGPGVPTGKSLAKRTLSFDRLRRRSMAASPSSHNPAPNKPSHDTSSAPLKTRSLSFERLRRRSAVPQSQQPSHATDASSAGPMPGSAVPPVTVPSTDTGDAPLRRRSLSFDRLRRRSAVP